MTKTADITIRLLDSQAIVRNLDDIAALRLTIFRDYPYLYDGNLVEERTYLSLYAAHGHVLLALDGEQVAGAITGMRLATESATFTAPFLSAGLDLNEFYYIGELLLYGQYRGIGLGSQLLLKLEQQVVLEMPSFSQMCCATVCRPDDHPLRPSNHLSIEPFCQKHGYTTMPGVVAKFQWKQIDETTPINSLQFWSKQIAKQSS